ncbi:unnamed protein product [Brachionus calyciflorus]|uniref:Uncharacterized protein n=1 Tax=Brachionus calyciflorus TaxID=104777 RepID=A0A813QQN6_9BILA|nr:unnamed protein product [Brachionus calyciflorus]
MNTKLIISSFLIYVLFFIDDTLSLKCLKCSNYGRSTNDFIFKTSCTSPTTEDQTTSCEGNYCFKSSVLLADLSSAILRGCSSSDKIYDLTTRLDGYQSQINFCNSTAFCNTSTRIHFNFFQLVTIIWIYIQIKSF